MCLRDEFEERRASGVDGGNLLRTVVNTARDAIVTVETNGTIVAANPATERLFGYELTELLGQNMSLLISSPDQGRHTDETPSKARIVGIGCEVEGRRKNGETFPIDLAVTETTTGNCALYTGILRDITERKRAMEALQASEQRFNVFMDASPALKWIKDLSGRYLFLNKTWEKVYGLDKEDWIGKTVLDVLGREQGSQLCANDQQVIDTGQPLEAVEQLELVDGRKLVWRTIRFPFQVGPGEWLLGGIATDITKESEAEESLLTAHRQLCQLLAYSPAVIYSIKIEGDKMFPTLVSDNIERLFGTPAGEGDHKWWMDSIHPDDKERVFATVKEGLKGNGYSMEYRFRHRDGHYLWIEEKSSVVRDDADRPCEIVGVWTDIHERKQAEQTLQQTLDELERRVEERTAALEKSNEDLTVAKEVADAANKAKSTFLSRMSHELRTPLNAVLGFAQLMQMDIEEPKHRESLAQIVKGGRHLLNLINEILDLAKIEAGRLSVSLEPVVLSYIIDEAVEMVRPLAGHRRIVIETSRPANEKLAVMADRQRLIQILLNLLSNAVKYNVDGGSIRLAWEQVEGRVRIDVSDTGRGISDADLGRLFVPFERLSDASTEGTGLGLVLSKGLAEVMNGSLQLAKTSPQGTTFSLDMEVGEVRPGLSHTPGEASGLPWMTEGEEPRTVLYMEDNLANVQLMESLVAKVGNIELTVAMQGRIGLELLKQYRPDVVLLDLHLPDMQGADVLAEIRRDPSTSLIPVIVVSADATRAQIAKLQAMGIESYMTKPLDVDRFVKLLNNIFSESDRKVA